MNRVIDTPEEIKQKMINAVESYGKDPNKCERCIHKKVCTYIESFKNLKSKIAKIDEDLDSNIFTVNVTCKYFCDETYKYNQNYNIRSFYLDT